MARTSENEKGTGFEPVPFSFSEVFVDGRAHQACRLA